MPTPLPPGFQLGMGKPEDAIAAFQARDLLQPSFRWQDVFNDEHTRAFAVAGVSRLDVLKVFQDELELTLAEGRSLKDFSKRIRPQLNAKGFWGPVEVTDTTTGETRVTTFDDARLRTIFEVNMRQSAASGRWVRAVRAKTPFATYRTMRDEHVRASHRAWDGVTLPLDDPFWDTHWAPCGYRCRCRCFGVTPTDIERMRANGLQVKTEAPPVDYVTYVNPRTGEVVPVPRGIDPGFGYNPGKQRDAALYEQLLRKSLKSSPLAGAVAVAQATLDHGAMVTQATREFGTWVDQVLAAAKPRGELKFVGSVKPQAVRALERNDVALQSSTIVARDQQVLQALAQAGDAQVTPTNLYRRLPELLDRASAILRDLHDTPLLYVVDLAGGAKLVVQLDTAVQLRRGTDPMNLVRGVSVMDRQALLDDTRYQLLWGAL